MVNALPRQLRNVNQPFQILAEFHKRAERGNCGNFSFNHVAHLILTEHVFLFVFPHELLRKNEFLVFFRRVHHLDPHGLSHKLAEVLKNFCLVAARNARIIFRRELRHPQKTAERPKQRHQPALIGIGNFYLNDFLRTHERRRAVPRPCESGGAERKFHFAVFVFFINHGCFNGVADFQICRHAARDFAAAHHANRNTAELKTNLGIRNREHRPLHHFARLRGAFEVLLQ